MGGGLLQLIATNAQDFYITGNPQITFFKTIYRRYTNFAIEAITQPLTGNLDFGRKLSANILQNGDLLSRMYVMITISCVDPDGTEFAWVRRLGHCILKQVDISIGASRIDRQYGIWLDIWYELARQGDHERGYAKMIGDVPELTLYNTSVKPEYTMFIPLQFWFNRNIGLALPIIALQYNDITIDIELEVLDKLIIQNGTFNKACTVIKNASLLINYVFLDTEERRRFAISGHEYLIDQLQHNGPDDVGDSPGYYLMDFNFAAKEIIWVLRNGNYTSGKTFIYYTGTDNWSVDDASRWILEKSVAIGANPNNGGTWQQVLPGVSIQIGNLFVRNNNALSVFINNDSLKIDTYSITGKITADIIINVDDSVDIENVDTAITIRDLSIPVGNMTDTRFKPLDPIVIQCNNYGLLIDGSVNPVEYAQIRFNGYDRFEKMSGDVFNYIEPFEHHTTGPRDGINVFSFALYPEQHQPSGTANLSTIKLKQLILWLGDSTFMDGLPNLCFINDDTKLFIFCLSYNILRIMSGIGGLAIN